MLSVQKRTKEEKRLSKANDDYYLIKELKINYKIQFIYAIKNNNHINFKPIATNLKIYHTSHYFQFVIIIILFIVRYAIPNFSKY